VKSEYKSNKKKIAVAIVIVALIAGAFFLLIFVDDSTADDIVEPEPVSTEINTTQNVSAPVQSYCNLTNLKMISEVAREYNPYWSVGLEHHKTNYTYYYEGGKLSRFFLNNVEKPPESNDNAAIVGFLTCEELGLTLFLEGNLTTDKWSKEHRPTGGQMWARYSESDLSGVPHILIEKRFFGEGQNVTIVYVEIQKENAFVTKRIELMYSTDKTNLDEIDTTKTIENWERDFEDKVEFFKSFEFSYEFN